MAMRKLLICMIAVLLGSVEARLGKCLDIETHTFRDYESSTHECKNGKVVSLLTSTSHPEAIMTFKTTPTYLTKATPKYLPNTTPYYPLKKTTKNPSKKTPNQRLKTTRYVPCKQLLTREKKADGYECCGQGIYHPDFQTCCYLMEYKYTVHEGMKHKDHACCGLDAYPRESMPCRSAARNDKLWEANRLTKEAISRANFCGEYKYAFLVTVRKRERKNKRYMAKIELISRPRKFTTNFSHRKMPLPYDEDSPRGKLRGKTFFIQSNTYHLSADFLDIFVENEDHIYVTSKKGKNLRKLKRILKKVVRKCRRELRKKRKNS